jgi:hypothetical protein
MSGMFIASIYYWCTDQVSLWTKLHYLCNISRCIGVDHSTYSIEAIYYWCTDQVSFEVGGMFDYSYFNNSISFSLTPFWVNSINMNITTMELIHPPGLRSTIVMFDNQPYKLKYSHEWNVHCFNLLLVYRPSKFRGGWDVWLKLFQQFNFINFDTLLS